MLITISTHKENIGPGTILVRPYDSIWQTILGLSKQETDKHKIAEQTSSHKQISWTRGHMELCSRWNNTPGNQQFWINNSCLRLFRTSKNKNVSPLKRLIAIPELTQNFKLEHYTGTMFLLRIQTLYTVKCLQIHWASDLRDDDSTNGNCHCANVCDWLALFWDSSIPKKHLQSRQTNRIYFGRGSIYQIHCIF